MGRHRNGTASASDRRPKPSNTSLPASGPSAGRRAISERQATTITAGSSAADSMAETGGGASLCASGSQLCTGAQPTLVAQPAINSRNPVSAA